MTSPNRNPRNNHESLASRRGLGEIFLIAAPWLDVRGASPDRPFSVSGAVLKHLFDESRQALGIEDRLDCFLDPLQGSCRFDAYKKLGSDVEFTSFSLWPSSREGIPHAAEGNKKDVLRCATPRAIGAVTIENIFSYLELAGAEFVSWEEELDQLQGITQPECGALLEIACNLDLIQRMQRSATAPRTE